MSLDARSTVGVRLGAAEKKFLEEGMAASRQLYLRHDGTGLSWAFTKSLGSFMRSAALQVARDQVKQLEIAAAADRATKHQVKRATAPASLHESVATKKLHETPRAKKRATARSQRATRGGGR